VFDGSPVGRDEEHPAWIDRHGMRLVPTGQALWIAELQYQRPADADDGLPGTYKVGAWVHTGRFDDPRLDSAGRSLADPASNGVALQHRGNHSLYAMADQMLWRQGARNVGVFARAMAAPGDRNRVDFSANAGLAFNGPFEERAADVLALGVGQARLSRCACASSGGRETFVEATYRYPIKPWWQVQADLQYVIRPGGLGAAQRIPNALMLGLRTSIVFEPASGLSTIGPCPSLIQPAPPARRARCASSAANGAARRCRWPTGPACAPRPTACARRCSTGWGRT
jgi:porin